MLLDLDDLSTNNGPQGLRSRTTDHRQLESYIDDPSKIPEGKGVDLGKVFCSLAVDHGRKGMFDLLVKMATTKSLRKELRTHDSAELYKAFCKATGTATLKDFCPGSYMSRITHKSETWHMCHRLVQLLAEIVDRSSIGSQLHAAAWQDQDKAPE
eukprot:SAG31_NODE_9895_length_1215_cov_1.108423_1_plen_154_part_10